MPRADDEMIVGFYDDFADDYHLAYGGDWESAVAHQGAALDALIRAELPEARDVLDCSCGIGTQAIGLARLGYRVTGTDISRREIERARREAERLGAEAVFAVADFRDLSGIGGRFDVVMSCDNAVPHLLDPADVPRTLAQMHAKLRPGGLLVITMRDFDRALIDKPPIATPVIVRGAPRRVLVRLHDWDSQEPCYTVRFLLLTEADSGWNVRARDALSSDHAGRADWRGCSRRVQRNCVAERANDHRWPAGHDRRQPRGRSARLKRQ